MFQSTCSAFLLQGLARYFIWTPLLWKSVPSPSPDCWKCSCWKCSFLTSWWWSSRQEPEHHHYDVHQSVQQLVLEHIKHWIKFSRASRRSSSLLHTSSSNPSLHTSVKKRFYKNVSIVQVALIWIAFMRLLLLEWGSLGGQLRST